jgi:phage tail-like protein
MPPTTRRDPLTVFSFLVDIGEESAAFFKSVSGLDAETAVIEYRTGNMPSLSSIKLPGLTKYSNIVLKRGLTADLTLWRWYKTTIDGQTQRRDGTITLLDTALKPVLRWRFRNGWICKWEGPDLDASANEVAIETIEIAHDGLELEGA